jgi:hypothetical protein
VTGLDESHLGKLFGTSKEIICFYLIHCKLLNKAQGTVVFKEWEGFVSSLPDSTERVSRRQVKPNHRVQLKLIRSRAGLGSQTAQYFLELSSSSTSTIANKPRRSGASDPSFPQKWPYLNGMVCPKPQHAPPEIRIKKNLKGPPRPRLEHVKFSEDVRSQLMSHFFDSNGCLALNDKMKDSIEALLPINFEGSKTKDLRLMITFDLSKS